MLTRAQLRKLNSEAKSQDNLDKSPSRKSTITRRRSGNFSKQIPKTPKKNSETNPENSEPETEDPEVFESCTPTESPTTSKFSTPLSASLPSLNQTFYNLDYTSIQSSSSNSLSENSNNTSDNKINQLPDLNSPVKTQIEIPENKIIDLTDQPENSSSLNENPNSIPINISKAKTTQKMEYEKKDTIPDLVQRRIPIFNGDGDTESTRYFLFQSQLIEDACNNDQNLINLALDECKAKLRGNAFSQMQNYKTTNFKEFRTFIKENFLPKFTIEEIKAKLMCARQMENESIPSFAKRIKSLKNDYAKCHEDKYGVVLTEEIINEDEKKAFVHGLKLPTARITLSGQIKQSIENLIDGAKAIEETEKLQNQGLHCQICQEIGHTGLSCPQMKEFVRSSQPLPQIPINTLIKCAKCLENGHTALNCPKLALKCEYCSKFNHNAEQCLKRRSDLRNSIKCAFCLKAGHNVSECRNKPNPPPFNQNNQGNPFLNYRNPQNHYTEKFCDFHKSRGHSTSECRRKREIESSQPQIPLNTNTQNTYTNTQQQSRPNNTFNQQRPINYGYNQQNYSQQHNGQYNSQPRYNETRPNNNQPYNQPNNNQQYNQTNNNQRFNNNQPNQHREPVNQNTNQSRNQPSSNNTDELARRFGNMQIHYMERIDEIEHAPQHPFNENAAENYNGSNE